MDLAIIHKTEEEEAEDSRLLDLSENYVKVDEIPFDFTSPPSDHGGTGQNR